VIGKSAQNEPKNQDPVCSHLRRGWFSPLRGASGGSIRRGGAVDQRSLPPRMLPVGQLSHSRRSSNPFFAKSDGPQTARQLAVDLQQLHPYAGTRTLAMATALLHRDGVRAARHTVPRDLLPATGRRAESSPAENELPLARVTSNTSPKRRPIAPDRAGRTGAERRHPHDDTEVVEFWRLPPERAEGSWGKTEIATSRIASTQN